MKSFKKMMADMCKVFRINLASPIPMISQPIRITRLIVRVTEKSKAPFYFYRKFIEKKIIND